MLCSGTLSKQSQAQKYQLLMWIEQVIGSGLFSFDDELYWFFHVIRVSLGREFLAPPIWEQAFRRELTLGEHPRWRTSPHVPPQNGALHKPANAPQPEMASVSNRSGKYTQEEGQHAV
jgi:hypothetical protein